MEKLSIVPYEDNNFYNQDVDSMLKELKKEIKHKKSFVFHLPKWHFEKKHLKYLLILIPIFLLVSFFFGFQNIKPIHVKNITIDNLWKYKTLAPVFSTALITDIDKNHKNDIIINSVDGKMYVLDGFTGKRKSYFETYHPIIASPLLSYVNKKPVIIIAGTGKKIYAVDANNQCLWSTIKQDIDTSVISTPALLSINNDKVKDVIVAGKDGKVYALDGNRGWKIWQSKYTAGKFFATPLPVSINKDKIEDIIIGSPAHFVYGIDGKTGIKIWETHTQGAVDSSALLYGNFVFVGDETGKFYKLKKETGEVVASFNFNTPIIATPTFLNKNTSPELVVPLKNGTIKTIDINLSKIHWSYNTGYQDPIVASPAVYDFNNDKCEDIVFASRNGYVYIINGKDGENLTEPYFAGNSISSSPVLGDINDDGYIDIVFGSENGYVYALTVKTVPDKIIKPNRIVFGSFLNRDKNL